MKLEAHETELIGSWLVVGGQTIADAAYQRIEWLISYHLEKIGPSERGGGWETLYGIRVMAGSGNGPIRMAKCMAAGRLD